MSIDLPLEGVVYSHQRIKVSELKPGDMFNDGGRVSTVVKIKPAEDSWRYPESSNSRSDIIYRTEGSDAEHRHTGMPNSLPMTKLTLVDSFTEKSESDKVAELTQSVEEVVNLQQAYRDARQASDYSYAALCVAKRRLDNLITGLVKND